MTADTSVRCADMCTSDDDLKKPKKLQFPTPDAMLRDHFIEGTDRYAYVQFMLDWF